MIAATPRLQYHPLSGFGSADYVEHYVELTQTSGVFDSLRYSAAELTLDKEKLDLAGFAAIGDALATLLAKAASNGSKTLRGLIIDHCQRFRVHVYDDVINAWVPLFVEPGAAGDATAAIDQHLDFGQMIDLIRALAGGVLRPLWSRLRSSGGETGPKSPPSSPSDSQAS